MLFVITKKKNKAQKSPIIWFLQLHHKLFFCSSSYYCLTGFTTCIRFVLRPTVTPHQFRSIWSNAAVVPFSVRTQCVKWCFATILHYRPLHLEKTACSPLSDRNTAKENRRTENLGRRVVCRSLFWRPGVLPHYSPLQGCSARWHERLWMEENTHTLTSHCTTWLLWLNR